MNASAAWSSEELARIDDAEELRVAPLRPDGGPRAPVIVWTVRVGDDVYARSVNGRDAAWFRAARVRHEGRVSAGGVDRDVRFVEIDAADPINSQLDAAYATKYRRYPGPVGSITGPLARQATLKLLPRDH